jgi:TIR domain
MANDCRPNLFLSHAWEDKDAFVRPLAEALSLEFDVWYDEYALKPGDSLLEKISEGLRSCDRGIVVLSRHFFEKRWTQAELNGLFALETKEKKILIPIWLDVTKEDVLQFSPILADIVAIQASIGIASVVTQIRGVIQGEAQTRQILGNNLSQQFAQIGSLHALRARQVALQRTPDGLRLITDQVKAAFDYFDQTADELQTHLKGLERARNDNHVVPYVSIHFPLFDHVDTGARGVATGPDKLTLRLDLTHISQGDALACRLGVRIFREIYDCGAFQRTEQLEELEFRPEFTEGSRVDWIQTEFMSPHTTKSFSLAPSQIAETIVENAFLRFTEVFSQRLNRHMI